MSIVTIESPKGKLAVHACQIQDIYLDIEESNTRDEWNTESEKFDEVTESEKAVISVTFCGTNTDEYGDQEDRRLYFESVEDADKAYAEAVESWKVACGR